MHDDRVRPNGAVCTDLNIPQDFSARTDHNAVADAGVSFSLTMPRAAEGHAVIEMDVVTDHSGFANDDAHAVVDEEASADLRARVDFDAGSPTHNL